MPSLASRLRWFGEQILIGRISVLPLSTGRNEKLRDRVKIDVRWDLYCEEAWVGALVAAAKRSQLVEDRVGAGIGISMVGKDESKSAITGLLNYSNKLGEVAGTLRTCLDNVAA